MTCASNSTRTRTLSYCGAYTLKSRDSLRDPCAGASTSGDKACTRYTSRNTSYQFSSYRALSVSLRKLSDICTVRLSSSSRTLSTQQSNEASNGFITKTKRNTLYGCGAKSF
jgi:hypothetical protein